MSIALLDPSDEGYKAALRRLKKAQKNATPAQDHNWTPFRAAEKRYMIKFPPPDTSDVLDLALEDSSRAEELGQSRWKGTAEALTARRVACAGGAKAFTFEAVPGLVVLPGYLNPTTQKEIIQWSLVDHAKAPNDTNLDVDYDLPMQGLWNAHVASLASDTSIDVQPRAAPQGAVHEPEGPRQLVNNLAGGVQTYDQLQAAPKLPPAPSKNARPTPASILMPKLRWANIGLSYHWGSKSYDFGKNLAPFPDRLTDICKGVVEKIDWADVWRNVEVEWDSEEPHWNTWAQDYKPDAGIVNYYQLSDTLMAHVDRSELSATSPLVSISLGQAAIFLIGSTSRDSEPVPLLLRSGDVLVMSGPVCRRAYHGVPRILDKTLPPHLKSQGPDDEWRPFADYLDGTRINVNVRQVFPKGFVPPKVTASVAANVSV